MDKTPSDQEARTRAAAIAAARNVVARMFDGYDAPEGVRWSPVPGTTADFEAVPRSETGDLIVHVHGGGFTLGSSSTYAGLLGRLAAAAGTRVVSCEYRLAPEHEFPAGLDDVTHALTRLTENGRPFAVVGDSAGGNLAIGALRRLHERTGRHAAALVLMSPLVQLEPVTTSYVENAESDAMFSTASLARLKRNYLNGHDPRDPEASPVYADVSALPPTMIFVSDTEVLRDEGIAFADRLRAADVPCDLHIVSAQTHAWPAFQADNPATHSAISSAADFIRDALESDRHTPGGPA